MNDENNLSKIIIRKETEADFHETELMTMRAFWNIHRPGCSEHYLVHILRKSSDYLPEYSRVAELNGKIVGAIFYSKARVVEGEGQSAKVHEIITFGPLAVEPTLQNSGVGSLLLKETFEIVRKTGYPGIIIFGEPKYYPKVGFIQCSKFGIKDPQGNCFDAMMAYPLDEKKWSEVHGIFYESSDFEACEDENAIAEYEKDFPPYPKVKLADGFVQIFGGRIGRIKEVSGNEFTVAFWELEIKAKLTDNFTSEKPVTGDVVIFNWKRNGLSEITEVRKN